MGVPQATNSGQLNLSVGFIDGARFVPTVRASWAPLSAPGSANNSWLFGQATEESRRPIGPSLSASCPRSDAVCGRGRSLGRAARTQLVAQPVNCPKRRSLRASHPFRLGSPEEIARRSS
jgi:hypothetical protein